MTKRNLAILAGIALLAIFAVYRDTDKLRSKQDATTAVSYGVATPFDAPGFALKGMDGQEYKVGGARDKPLLLNFWASWCGPCEEEAPDLAMLYNKYKDELDVYAVNVTGNDDEAAARAFAERYGFRFQVLLDSKLVASELYRVQVIPTSFLIDRSGQVTEVIHLLPAPELEKKLKKLIAK